jgi:hypothetical protein
MIGKWVMEPIRDRWPRHLADDGARLDFLESQ